ncbi:MAG: nucleoside hydrolase [Geodermatophilaceae bacterium]
MHWISGAASGTLSGVPIDDAVLTAALAETGVDHGPGLFGLVTEHGEVVFEGSVGVADLARPRPIAAQDRFRIASVTKTYVAALVMQLIAEGRLSLDDSVQQRLPGLVPDSSEITVELLLRMRSGLPDWVGPVFGDPPDIRVLDRYWAPTELVEIALTADSRVAPGTGYRYCNTDYALLGLMIERVTGQSVEAQLWQRIFQPLHLDDTSFPTVEPQIRGPHASGHLRDRPGARWSSACWRIWSQPKPCDAHVSLVPLPPRGPVLNHRCRTERKSSRERSRSPGTSRFAGRSGVRRLVIDTDPGVDDAIALLVALASPEVELCAVTTVFGNVNLEQTTDNALRVLALVGADEIPVAAGADRPLVHPQPHRASHVHGANGLGGAELPGPKRRVERAPAVRFLADLLHASPSPLTVCAIGPLTNIALLVASDPAAANRIERLVIMGGAYGPGNVTPTAEFNVWSDPEAAHRVLGSGLPITVVGLDVTRPTAMDAAAVARIGASGPVGSAAAAMLAHYLDYYYVYRAARALSSTMRWPSSRRSRRGSWGPSTAGCRSTVGMVPAGGRRTWIGGLARARGSGPARATSLRSYGLPRPSTYPGRWPRSSAD